MLIIVIISVGCKKPPFGIPNENDDGNGNGDTTVFTLGVPQIKPLPIVWEQEYNAGNVNPGDHTQHMLDLAFSESDPDRIYMGQDVCNIWVSKDNGLNWFTLRNQGLYSPFVISIEADPLNKNRLLAATQCRYYDGVNQNYQGIYQSLDGGITWQKKMARAQLGEVRSSTKLIAHAPTSKDAGLGYATRWYAAFGEYKETLNGDELVADDGLVYSDDGGESWTETRKLSAGDFGDKIRGIKVHTTKPEKVFIYGNGGLYRFEDATDPSGNVTKLSGRNGLPEGDIWGRLYQSPDAKTLIIAVARKGIYKSVNAGANWSQLYNWADVNYCYVNENFPDKIFAVPYQASAKQIKISSDGGQTWAEPTNANIQYRPGYGGGDWIKKLNGQFTCVIPDLRDANKVFIHTKSKNFRSDDGGVSWSISDYGFNGSCHNGAEQMFDPVDPDRFAYFMVDRGVMSTSSRGRYFRQNTIDQTALGLNWSTSIAGALHPTEDIILASVGKSPNGKLLYSPDNGVTWTVANGGNSNKARWVIAYDLQNPDHCYQSNERSSDGGQSWTPIPNMAANTLVCGVSRTNGSIIYAMNALAQQGNGRKIWRSANRGDSLKLVIDAAWDLTFPGPNNRFVFSVDPVNPDIVYTSSANGHITKWDVSVSPAQATHISVGGVSEPDFFINLFAIDSRYPNVMYAANQRANTGNVFFRSIDGGLTWQNISNYISQGSVKGLSVSPVTGEVYISSQNGSLVMLPPYTTSNTAYEVVPYTNNHIIDPY